jgi:hypothetical protein
MDEVSTHILPQENFAEWLIGMPMTYCYGNDVIGYFERLALRQNKFPSTSQDCADIEVSVATTTLGRHFLNASETLS